MSAFSEPYEHLAAIYDSGWGGFAPRYAEFVQASLRERGAHADSVLDVGCGTGSLVLALAQLGLRAHGIDQSPPMIAMARSKSCEAGGVSFSVARMESYASPAPVSLITSVFGTVNYILNSRALGAFFACTRLNLQERGMFVFDFNTPTLFERHHSGVIPRDVDGKTVIQELDYDPQSRLATTTFRFPGGNLERHHQRAYSWDQVELLLLDHGFDSIGVFANLRFEPHHPDSERAIVVCRRVKTD